MIGEVLEISPRATEVRINDCKCIDDIIVGTFKLTDTCRSKLEDKDVYVSGELSTRALAVLFVGLRKMGSKMFYRTGDDQRVEPVKSKKDRFGDRRPPSV